MYTAEKMKLLARILIMLSLNKLSMQEEPALQNINLTAEYKTLAVAARPLVNFESETFVIESPLKFRLRKDETEDIKDTSDRLDEIDKSVTAKSLASWTVLSNSSHLEETDYKPAARQLLEGVNSSATAQQTTTQNQDKIPAQTVSSSFEDSQIDNLLSTHIRPLSKEQEEKEAGEDLDGTANTIMATKQLVSDSNSLLEEKYAMSKALPDQFENVDKYGISSVSKVLINQQKDNENKLINFNQSWTENRAKTINEYKIATKFPNSNDLTQNSNLPESELIEIVLKEAVNLNKNLDGKKFGQKLAPSSANSFELSNMNMTESTLAVKANTTAEQDETSSILLTSAAPEVVNEVVSILSGESPQNYSAGVSELMQTLSEWDTNSNGRQVEQRDESTKATLFNTTATASEGMDMNVKEAKIFNSIKADLKPADLAAIENMNKIQEATTLGFMETTPNDVDEFTPKALNIRNTSQTHNETISKPIAITYLSVTKSSVEVSASTDAINEINASKRYRNSNETEIKVEDEVLGLNKQEEDQHIKPFQNSVHFATNDLNPEPLKPFGEHQHSAETGASKESKYLSNTTNENAINSIDATSPLGADILKTKLSSKVKESDDFIDENDDMKEDVLVAVSTHTGKDMLANAKPVNSSNKPDKELRQVTSSSDKSTDFSSTERLAYLATSSRSNIESTPQPWYKFVEPTNNRANENQQLHTEYSSLSSEEIDTSSCRPTISLEDYAVKQMNFILDHLLLETQKFVAKVLQATINSVFPRDRLKHYAEGVNQVLNPIVEKDYSGEFVENTGAANQDEIYEQIVEKLDFLRSKPSKYLQKQIPPEWLEEFLRKRAELAVWLDKAAEQMHKEFTDYITEEEDPIKYQYFGETFDDISRATEIHHKLALLADLVKIIKNKKQITFMDLYMQT